MNSNMDEVVKNFYWPLDLSGFMDVCCLVIPFSTLDKRSQVAMVSVLVQKQRFEEAYFWYYVCEKSHTVKPPEITQYKSLINGTLNNGKKAEIEKEADKFIKENRLKPSY